MGDRAAPGVRAEPRPDVAALTASVEGLPQPVDRSDTEQRILDAALVLIARWGFAKTTLANVAREAGCGRSTLYRLFPGGRDQLFLAVGAAELRRFLDQVSAAVDRADTTEDALVAVLTTACRFLADAEALQFVLTHEPGAVMPFLGFDQTNRLYAAGRLVVGPHLEPFLGARTPWVTEWLGRVVLSYGFHPAPHLDLRTDADARLLVRTFLLPALSRAVPSTHGS